MASDHEGSNSEQTENAEMQQEQPDLLELIRNRARTQRARANLVPTRASKQKYYATQKALRDTRESILNLNEGTRNAPLESYVNPDENVSQQPDNSDSLNQRI